MNIKYGYSPEELERAKEEIHSVLIEVAKYKRTIAYSDLVSKIRCVNLEAESHALAALLDEISSEENTAGRGMLSVVVVHKHGDMKPGHGFFSLAKNLGREVSDYDEFWVKELERVHEYWSKS